MRHTKIIATIGPASSGDDTLEQLIRAGADMVRLNFSHGDRPAHLAAIGRVREAARRAGRYVAVLQDLSGPKIRTGRLAGGQPLRVEAGESLVLALTDAPGRPGRITTTYAPLFRALTRGVRLLLDDGRVELEVLAVDGDHVLTRVIDGGEIGERKGINAPDVPLPAGPTEKDEADLRAGLAAGVDLVAVSFVQAAADLDRARSVAVDAGRSRVPIIAKLERPEAIRHLEEIAAASDALMVARGDLGLELPLERVPGIQKEVLRLAGLRGVPVIVATQVLESMRTEFRPTRAEVSDAAGAVDAGAAAIMLSGETAIGEYPVRTVQVLDTVITQAEAAPPLFTLTGPAQDRADHLGALCDAAVTLAMESRAHAIIALTRQGRTARVLSARRPAAPIFAATNTDEVARRLCLWRSVQAIEDPLEGDADAVVSRVVSALRARHALPQLATVVIVSANPNIERPGVNFVAVRRV